MSAMVPQPEGPPEPAAGEATREPGVRRGRATFGIVMFVLAVVVFLVEPALNALVNTARFLPQASTISATVISIQMLAVLAVLALALIAALRRSGTSWAVAAIAITLAGNSWVRGGVSYLFEVVFTALYGTPTVRF